MHPLHATPIRNIAWHQKDHVFLVPACRAGRADRAGVLAINNEPFKSGELLDKMLRLDFKNDDKTCIAPLVPFRKGQSDNQQMALQNAFNGAIGDVFRSSVRSWKKVIQHYVLENTDFLIRMMPEIEFVTKATELLVKLKERGCPLCHPEIRPISEKAFDAKGLCNPIVAMKLDTPVVPNDFVFDEQGMIYVLTGPNRGGKSVITCLLADQLQRMGNQVGVIDADPENPSIHYLYGNVGPCSAEEGQLLPMTADSGVRYADPLTLRRAIAGRTAE